MALALNVVKDPANRTFLDEFLAFNWVGADGVKNAGTNETWKTWYYHNDHGGRTHTWNGEQQYYSDPSTAVPKNWTGKGYVNPHSIIADPFQAGDNVLRVTASKSPDLSPTTGTDGLPYISGLITTEPSFSQRYGYFEINMKVPDGAGLWPAFWMLPDSKTWPPEIDAVEYFGAANGNGDGGDTKYWYYVNSASANHKRGTWYDTEVDLSEGFHSYGVLWAPDYITFYFDGQEVPGSKSLTPPDLHQKMYMIANLAVGGHWPGQADDRLFGDPTNLPHLDIDYIQAFDLPGQRLNGAPGSKNDVLTGGTGYDVINGGAGDDRLTGGVSADRFVFGPSLPVGRDVITDFTPTLRQTGEHDLIEIPKGLVRGLDTHEKLLSRVSETSNGNSVIDLGKGNSITLLGVRKSELSSDDFNLF